MHPGGEQELIELMEGVEDIPGTALWEGIDWQWESFPEYLDALAGASAHGRRRYARAARGDARLRHGRARRHRHCDAGRPRGDGRHQRAGIAAGALGVSTTRILAHHTSRGHEVPGTFADEAELTALAGVLRELGTGVFEVVPRGMDGEVERGSRTPSSSCSAGSPRSPARASRSRSCRPTPSSTGGG